MKVNFTFFISILTLLTSCSGQVTTQRISSGPLAVGDTVRELSHNVMVIYQDRKNNYWFGSWEDGLYKYDGTSIVHYSTEHGLPSNRVQEIKEDSQGNVYFNTGQGIMQFNGQVFSLLREAPWNSENWSLSATDLWFKNMTDDRYVYRYDGTVLHKLELPRTPIGEEWIQKNPGSSNPYSVYCMYRDSKGNMWFGTAASGVFRYDGSRFDWITENDVNEFHYGPSNGVRAITEDRDGYFWFNTEYKYAIYNQSPSIQIVQDSTPFYNRITSIGFLDGNEDNGLNEYLSIIRDDKGNLWIATYLDGVWKVDGERIEHYPIQVNGTNITVFCLYQDNNGDIWLGTHENGAFRLNGNTFERFTL